MRVGLNATCLNDRPSGAKQRFIGIYGELFKRMPEVEFVIFEPVDCRISEWFEQASNISFKTTPIPSEGRFHKFVASTRYWPKAFSLDSFDIYEGFHMPLVRSPRGKTLLTVHDIRGVYSENSMLRRTIFKGVLKQSLKAADHVITVSETMKDEILNFFPNIPISVIYNGLDASEFEQITELDLINFRQKYAVSDGYVLSVGHFEKRKNYLHLIDSVELLRSRGCDCSLLIIGNDSGGKKTVEARVAAKKLSGNVKILSDLTDHEVRCAYKLCGLFIFPSAYEGFGIPILEAMAAQRLMVLSDLPVFRELTENRGIYFPFSDIEAIASAIEYGLSSHKAHAHLIEYGQERIQEFSFKTLAKQLEGVYRSLM